MFNIITLTCGALAITWCLLFYCSSISSISPPVVALLSLIGLWPLLITKEKTTYYKIIAIFSFCSLLISLCMMFGII